MIASELSERDEFGTVRCDLPGFEHVWVKFKTRGYPFKLRREWQETRDDRKVLEIVLRYVEQGHLIEADGQVLHLLDGSRSAELLDGLEDALAVWLIRAFRYFWQIELTAPRKNLLPLSPSLPPAAADSSGKSLT